MTITYKRILSKDNEQVKNLITIVLDELENLIREFAINVFLVQNYSFNNKTKLENK